MQYGYFDESKKEYVITRPDTPSPWANYLGSPEYGAIISNNAGGYSFVRSGAEGRIIRYVFNHQDTPGRYIYLRDEDSGDFWSASWQPVGKDQKEYKNECRHGTSYTEISAEYAGIKSDVLYYVPLGKMYEVWRLNLTNQSEQERHISTTGYVEFTNHSSAEKDTINSQYTFFITRTHFKGNKIMEMLNENYHKTADGTNKKERFFGQAGAEVLSYEGDRTAFLGDYRSYSNPIAIENGKCSNTLNFNSNACGALQSSITLKPGETKQIVYLVGRHTEEDADAIIARYQTPDTAAKELEELKQYWHGKLQNLVVKTPNPDFDCMVNTWNAYQCFITFTWSRAASFVYNGLRNGYGYRDTVQDIQGIIHLDPEMALAKLRLMLSGQVNTGGGLPLVAFDHKPGSEGAPADVLGGHGDDHNDNGVYRADDALWLFPTVFKYIAETGEKEFLDEVIPYANCEEGTVYDHLKRAVDFSVKRSSVHGMPAGLHADWNDCLRLGTKGESVFVAMQLYYAMSILRLFAEEKKDTAYLAYLDKVQKELENNIQTHCWEDDRFIRGYAEDGQIIGSKTNKEASMWLNPQSWSVISGIATKDQAEKALESVNRELNTTYGARIMAPSYKDHAFEGALMLKFNPSTKENGGIFSQTQGWIILAEALMNHGDRAFEYFLKSAPSAMNDKAEIRRMEPYVHGQFIESVESPFEGRSNVHWLTGTASTVMVGCVEGILGLRPDLNGITISPAIPSDWKGLEMRKQFQGKTLNIRVENPNASQGGCKELLLNGVKMENAYIPSNQLKQVNDIVVVL